MVVYGNTYDELKEIQNKVIGMLRKNRNLSRIESDYSTNKPEVKIEINKNKAKDLGISAQAIGQTLETLYGGKTVTKFNKLGKEYPIILQQYLEDRKDKEESALGELEELSEQMEALESDETEFEAEEEELAKKIKKMIDDSQPEVIDSQGQKNQLFKELDN